MRAKSFAMAALAMAALMSIGTTASGHDDPRGCTTAGAALTVSLFRADGRTGLVGEASECERVQYQVRLAKVAPDACAFSSGTLTLTTPDGVVHTVADPVPCVGGSGDDPRGLGGPIECRAGTAAVEGEPIAYAVRPSDARDGRLKAVARYERGIVHDGDRNTPGLSATVDRTVAITLCDDADPCTVESCDPLLPSVAACSTAPLCDDADPTTIDTCSAGRCTFTAVASSDRLTCGGAGR